MIRVALIEDDADIRDNLMLIIDRAEGFSCRQAFSDVQEAGKSLLNDPPDVLLMDITLPGKLNGIEGVEFLRAAGATFETIMLTVHQEEKLVFDALCAGACGYLTKNTPPNRILDALREAHRGGAPMSTQIARMVVDSFKRTPPPALSEREREVLAELCQGKSYKMVADALYISQDTVRTHIRSIYRKLEVNSKSEAVAKALKERLI